MKTKEIRILKDLISVKESCEQGLSGEWDCSGEGREGFEAMSHCLDDAITVIPELLDAAQLAVRQLREHYNDDECEAIQVLLNAIKKTTE